MHPLSGHGLTQVSRWRSTFKARQHVQHMLAAGLAGLQRQLGGDQHSIKPVYWYRTGVNSEWNSTLKRGASLKKQRLKKKTI